MGIVGIVGTVSSRFDSVDFRILTLWAFTLWASWEIMRIVRIVGSVRIVNFGFCCWLLLALLYALAVWPSKGELELEWDLEMDDREW